MIELKRSVARFVIKQMIDCPYCGVQFDIIKANLESGANQGTITINQSVHEKADDMTAKKQVEITIPKPPYFGAFNETCVYPDGQEEHIDCVHCKKTIQVKQVDWDYIS